MKKVIFTCLFFLFSVVSFAPSHQVSANNGNAIIDSEVPVAGNVNPESATGESADVNQCESFGTDIHILIQR